MILVRRAPLLALLAVLLIAVRAAVAAEGWAGPFTTVASAVWQAVGEGRRIAARPLDPDTTGLPPELAA